MKQVIIFENLCKKQDSVHLGKQNKSTFRIFFGDGNCNGIQVLPKLNTANVFFLLKIKTDLRANLRSQRSILSFPNVLVWTVENASNSSVDANRSMRFR